jgi:hypothetical protein
MRRASLAALIFLISVPLSGCGAKSPTAPSGPSVAISKPLLLSGQSNALMVAPSLSAIYPKPVLTVAESGRSISGWDAGVAGNHWAELVPLLQQPLQALAWWQGESDRDNPDYLNALRDLIARVRVTNGNAQLLVIEVRVLDLPQNASVRAAQETFVRTDTNAVLISSDGFQLDNSDHLTDGGYRAVAQRIYDAARSSSAR